MTDYKRVPREPTREMIEAATVGLMFATKEKVRAGLIAAYDAAPAVSDEHDDVALVVELKNLLRQHLDAMTRLDNALAEDTRAALAKPFNVRCSNCGKTMKEHDKLARCQSTSCAALKAALRQKCVKDRYCWLCGAAWETAERHAPGCLAAPTTVEGRDVQHQS